jgi:hypothetical protein
MFSGSRHRMSAVQIDEGSYYAQKELDTVGMEGRRNAPRGSVHERCALCPGCTPTSRGSMPLARSRGCTYGAWMRNIMSGTSLERKHTVSSSKEMAIASWARWG